MGTASPRICSALAEELGLERGRVERCLALLAEGATVPFLARYRKEATGGLDEVQLAAIKDRSAYLSELEARRAVILETIEAQGRLDDELRGRIEAARTRTELEDLYLPYRPKRRTRATLARDRGLEPLADAIWEQRDRLDRSREELARSFVSAERDVPDQEAAWQGARDICAERIAEDAILRSELRRQAWREGRLSSRPATRRRSAKAPEDPAEHARQARKYADYHEHQEPVARAPSHRVLALQRGESEGFLRVRVELDERPALDRVRRRTVENPRAALADQLELALQDAWQRLLYPAIENDTRRELEERAGSEAIRIFAENLQHVLMAAPFGARSVLAIDPGFRTGCKVVALDATGALLEQLVIHPHPPRGRAEEARRQLESLAARHQAEAIAVGNGTAGRETLSLVRQLQREGGLPAGCVVVSVNESGASVYSASDVARQELPDQDVTVRGAVSIGRRLQDPLSELVKIDPKSIGVGQYQHDVSQPELKQALDGVVETCVNRVGVELNTASARLLSYVSGLGEGLARAIVTHRNEHGPFLSRRALMKVPRLGAKKFEQAAGFLRVREATNPLDRSAVHPESYEVVLRMARDLGVELGELLGNGELLHKVDITRYMDERRGEPTLRDILDELARPGRDPRASFEEEGFRDDVTELEHLHEGMLLAGVVTNVTGFGAFVDVGVHQDGLVHISELAHRFVENASDVVKPGDRVKVKVLAVDTERRRIGLSIKQALDEPGQFSP